jgi:DUF1365 family protein
MAVSDTVRLYSGEVMHRRDSPAVHAFRYGVFFVRWRIDAGPQTWPSWIAHNRRALCSLSDVDYGPRDGSPLLPWIRKLLHSHGLASADGEIWLQTFPRLFGYVFNPVSFWLCHDRTGALRAVLAEVNNTFGEHHNYLVAHGDARPILPGDHLTARKVFHVSPFFPVAGEYRFRFCEESGHCRFHIDYDDGKGHRLATRLAGSRVSSTRSSWLKLLTRYPVMTFAVVARIHLHALFLWWKRVPFFSKPSPPVEETSR